MININNPRKSKLRRLNDFFHVKSTIILLTIGLIMTGCNNSTPLPSKILRQDVTVIIPSLTASTTLFTASVKSIDNPSNPYKTWQYTVSSVDKTVFIRSLTLQLSGEVKNNTCSLKPVDQKNWMGSDYIDKNNILYLKANNENGGTNTIFTITCPGRSSKEIFFSVESTLGTHDYLGPIMGPQ